MTNKFFTFDRRKFSHHKPVIFAYVSLAGWFLNLVIYDATLKIIRIQILAILASTSVSNCANCAGQKWIVFRIKRSAT